MPFSALFTHPSRLRPGLRFLAVATLLATVVATLAAPSSAQDAGDCVSQDGGGVVHVAPGGEGDGSSWASPLDDLVVALALVDVDTVCLAAGTYVPGEIGVTTTDRRATFEMVDVTVLGGFNPADGSRDPVESVTELSGDINVPGLRSDNSFHVVTTSGDVVLDGVVIRDGQADSRLMRADHNAAGLRVTSGTTTLHDVALIGNHALRRGGAALVEGGATLVATDTAFGRRQAGSVGSLAPGTSAEVLDERERNEAEEGAGLAVERGASVDLDRVIFANNHALGDGGGLNVRGGSATVTNAVFTRNQGFDGGAFHCDADPTETGSVVVECELALSTIAFNTGRGAAGGVHLASGRMSIVGSIIWSNLGGNLSQDSDDGLTGGQSLIGETDLVGPLADACDDDPQGLARFPLFIDGEAGHLELTGSSPGVDCGEGLEVREGLSDRDRDINGDPRGPVWDIGAFATSNAAPVANDDEFTTQDDGSDAPDEHLYVATAGMVLIVPPADGILTNDSDPTGDPIYAEIDDDTGVPGELKHERVDEFLWLDPGQQYGTGGFSYTPPADFTGPVTFTYWAVDLAGEKSNLATVTIMVEPPASPGAGDGTPGGSGEGGTPAGSGGGGTPAGSGGGGSAGGSGGGGFPGGAGGGPTVAVAEEPVAIDDVAVALAGVPVQIRVAANDSLPDGAGVVWTVDQPSGGTAVFDRDGTLTYTPRADFAGLDRFGYTASVDGATASAHVTVAVGTDVAAGHLSPGETLDTEAGGVSRAMPMGVRVVSPIQAPVAVAVNPTAESASGQTSGIDGFGWEADISFPPAPAGSPYELRFSFHRSALPDGATTVTLLRNGEAAQPCRDTGQPTPSPCVVAQSVDGDVVTVDVLTLEASVWSVGSDPVTRIAGDSRITTAVAVSRAAFPSAAHALIASAGNFADALAGSPLAGSLGAPLLLTDRGRLNAPVAEELRRLGVEGVTLLGGPSALSEQIAADLRALEIEVARISGPDRFATAAAVGAELQPTTAYLALGAHEVPSRAWPDAVAVAGLAARQAVPVLLTSGDTLAPATAEFLSNHQVDTVTILGGTNAIRDTVVAAVRDLGVPNISRIAGASRFETSAAIADLMVADGADSRTVWVASGRAWPDALAAGPAVAAAGGVLVLSDTGDTSQGPGSGTWIDDHRDQIAAVRLLGGTAALSDGVAEGIRATLDSATSRPAASFQQAQANQEVTCVDDRPVVIPPDDGTDSDGDGLTDYEELTQWGTAPLTADTDGDGLDDHTEIYDMGFDPVDRPRVFNPLVADTASVKLEMVSPPSIELLEDTTTLIGTEQVAGWETSHSQTESTETGFEYSNEWGGHFRAMIGNEVVAGSNGIRHHVGVEFELQVNYNHVETHSTVNTVGTESTEALSRSQARIREESVNATGGWMGVTVDLVNTGHVSFSLDDATINVLQRDEAGILQPVTSLRRAEPEGGPIGRTLGPGQRITGMVFSADDLTVATTRALLVDPSGLVLRTDDIEFSVLHEDSRGDLAEFPAGFLQQSIGANTALIQIDSGDGTTVEQHAVSAVASRGTDGLLHGLPACVAVSQVLALPVEVDEAGGLTRVGDVRVAAGENLVVLHTTASGNSTLHIDLDGVLLRPGAVLRIIRIPDGNDDHLPDIHELAEGVAGVLTGDVDGDGLSTRDEVAYPRRVMVIGSAPRHVYSSPALVDTDGDGLTDREEAIGMTDPRRIDTDGDGLADGPDLPSTSFREFTPGEWDAVCETSVDPGFTGPGCDPLNPDTDGDGIADGGSGLDALSDRLEDLLLVGTGQTGDGLHVLRGRPTVPSLPPNLLSALAPGSVSSLPNPPEHSPVKVATGDINGDGFDDLIVLERGERILVHWCDENGLGIDTAVVNTYPKVSNVNVHYPNCPALFQEVDNRGETDDDGYVYLSRDATITVSPGSETGFSAGDSTTIGLVATDEMWADVHMASGGDVHGADGFDDVVLLTHGTNSKWGPYPGVYQGCWNRIECTIHYGAEPGNPAHEHVRSCEQVSNDRGLGYDCFDLRFDHEQDPPRWDNTGLWFGSTPVEENCRGEGAAGAEVIAGLAFHMVKTVIYYDPPGTPVAFDRLFSTHPNSSLEAGWNGYVFHGAADGTLSTGYDYDNPDEGGGAVPECPFVLDRAADFVVSDDQLPGSYAIASPPGDNYALEDSPNGLDTHRPPTYSPRADDDGLLLLGDAAPDPAGYSSTLEEVVIISHRKPADGDSPELRTSIFQNTSGDSFRSVGDLALPYARPVSPLYDYVDADVEVRAVLANIHGRERPSLVFVDSLTYFDGEPRTYFPVYDFTPVTGAGIGWTPAEDPPAQHPFWSAPLGTIPLLGSADTDDDGRDEVVTLHNHLGDTISGALYSRDEAGDLQITDLPETSADGLGAPDWAMLPLRRSGP